MGAFVLVHGAWMGAWAWHQVVPLLEAAGHRVAAPNLPGHGVDCTPVSECSLQSYAQRIVDILESQSQPAVLVGHSMGGAVVSQAAEMRPDRIARLVYLTAYLPRDGESIYGLAMQDQDSRVGPNLVMNEAQGTIGVREDAMADVFFHDCSPASVALARALAQSDPLAPLGTPVRLSNAAYGRVPRTYIQCLNDRVISPALQRQMYNATPCDQVLSLSTGHAPFLAAPQRLADLLLGLGGAG